MTRCKMIIVLNDADPFIFVGIYLTALVKLEEFSAERVVSVQIITQ